MRAHGEVQEPPTILFFETGTVAWHSMSQFSAVMRKRGWRTVRVCDDSSRRSRLLNRLVFDASIVGESPAESWPLPIDVSSIVDVQSTEWAFRAALEAARKWGVPSAVQQRLVERSVWLDKLAATKLLDGAGIATPECLDAGHDIADAFAQLGSPLVIKRRVGAGGHEMAVVRSAQEAEGAFSTIAAERSQLLFQRFQEGTKYQYVAVVSEQGVEQEAVLGARHLSSGHGGPTAAYAVVNDRALAATGARVAQAVTTTGLLNVDIVRGADGTDWVIDVNLRCWHGLVGLRAAGLDMAQGYEWATARRGGKPRMRHAEPGAHVVVYPPERPVGRRPPLRDLPVAIGRSSPYIRWLGPSYCLAELSSLIAAMRPRLGVWR